MHLIKDENGNLVQHGHGHTHEHTHEDGMTHTHEHTHGEGHDHGHSHADHACDTAHCGSCSEGDCKNETLALLTLPRWEWMQHVRLLRKLLQIFRKAI